MTKYFNPAAVSQLCDVSSRKFESMKPSLAQVRDGNHHKLLSVIMVAIYCYCNHFLVSMFNKNCLHVV